MMGQIAVIVRNPQLPNDDENALDTVFYDEDCTVWYVTKSLYEHDGLELLLKATIEEHHGEEFTEQYGDELVNDSRVQEFTLKDLAGNALDYYAEQEYPEEEWL